MKDERKMVYKSTLKQEFGLTDRLIRELGEPDDFVQNPHYKSGPPAALYDVKRVKRFVRNRRRALAIVAEKRQQRKNAAAKGVSTKISNLLGAIDNRTISVAPLPKNILALIDKAQAYTDSRYGFNAHRVGPDGVIAFVRHNYSNYEEFLKEIAGKVGNDVGYETIRSRFDEEIEAHVLATFPDFYTFFDCKV